ncbi:DNA helicase-primase complex component [Harp seal herpesvirus]|uniref:DNA helicase-primase complex component n=1 Tax=phocid gammaherpesvirus 3 TaxID=2560643 RepID=A0A0R5Z6A3_9GAMA|nr:DNA helicase-primase complex component [Harp seal herpesvirus]AJG42982.1 DNA helicase-primase complex component [Harp seal herpesvirus]
MTTDANSMPCGTDTPSFMAIFATDGDSAEIITDILTNTDNAGNFYCVLHNCYSYNITEPEILLTLALPAKRPGGGKKCLPVLQIKLPWPKALSFLLHGKPLPASVVQSSLNYKTTRRYFKPILDVLMCNHKAPERQQEDIKSKIYWFRAKFVITLRKLFRITPSPFWMIATFGTFEAPFVLVSSLYFFENHSCTVETLHHLSLIFQKKKGHSLASITTFSELGCMFGNSEFLSAVPQFFSYTTRKLQRDDFESQAIDLTVNSFRGELMMSNQDLIHYIYLSFFQCLGKTNFLDYSLQTDYTHFGDLNNNPILAGFIDDSFKQQMSTYYNKTTYLKNHISVDFTHIPGVRGYSCYNQCSHACSGFQFWSGQSKDVQNLMRSVNAESPNLMLQEELQGLLDFAATAPDDARHCTKSDIFPTVHTNPVFRCQFLNKNYFVIVNEDILTQVWKNTVLLPQTPNWATTLTDMQITERIFYKETFFSLNNIKDQLQISRHEYFNVRLPVFNLVLDFDLPLGVKGLTLHQIYEVCLAIRDDVIQILQLLGDINPQTHQVYFFKSSCPPLEWDLDEKMFCNCSEKLGLRIVTNLPRGVAIVGSEPLITLVKILNRMVKMNPLFLNLCPTLLDSDGPFDSGIYHKGRCVRIPHTYKVNIGGGLERLLKIIVCHPHVTDKSEYINGCMQIQNLLHHSNPSRPAEATKVIFNVTDISEHFLLQKTKESLPRSVTNISCEIQKSTGMEFLDWVTHIVWPKIFHNIKAYLPDDKAFQFHYVKFIVTGHNIIQVKPQRQANFVCISHNHKAKSQNVRIFIVLYTHQVYNVTATLMSQCFANKCNNNKPKAHFSLCISLHKENLDQPI